ncbi:hypothetical protein CEXT_48001 [Caerostris extrusa]|uniref:Chromo domain-containing protein n=1 Tax=Caerostris extrusa TaxID=172846 RepID=A0AAV4MUR1_CAEEX|nr:hypothetical protein CEXT_48001 [Caerostris extrusa]
MIYSSSCGSQATACYTEETVKSRREVKFEKLDWLKLDLQPERIIGVKDVDGELMLLVKWKDYDAADLVPSKTANIKWPQDVIRFYEKQIFWEDEKEPPSDEDAEKNEKTSA